MASVDSLEGPSTTIFSHFVPFSEFSLRGHMATERKENSVLFSLRELKGIASDEQPNRQSPVKPRSKTAKNNKSGFIDDKDSLLADIRSGVTAEAEQEAQRIAEDKRQAEQAAAQRIQETAAVEKAEIEARLAAERARRRAAEEEREARAAQIEHEAAYGTGEFPVGGVTAGDGVSGSSGSLPQLGMQGAPIAARAATQPGVAIPGREGTQPGTAAPPAGRGGAFYLAVFGGVTVVCATIIAIVVVLRPKEVPPPPPAQPVIERVQMVTTPPPAPEPAEPEAVLPAEPDSGPAPDAAVKAAPAVANSRRSRRRRSAAKRRGKSKPAAKTPGRESTGKTGKRKIKVDLDEMF